MPTNKSFGELFRELRVKKRLTLRQFCSEYNFDPGNISRLERGMLAPPQTTDKLTEYARALGLKERSEEWIQFFDLAYLANRQIPPDILSNKELVHKLPLFLRTLGGKKLSPKKLDQLVEQIRRA